MYRQFIVLICGALLAASAQATVIYSSWNLDVVYNGPAVMPQFTLASSWQIDSIEDYHYNYGSGSFPTGTISLYDVNNATTIGTWGVAATSPANTSWLASPGIVLGPGTYRIIDSEASTWSYSTTDYYAYFGRDGANWAPNVGFSLVNATEYVVPEPSLFALAALALLPLGAGLWRRRSVRASRS